MKPREIVRESVGKTVSRRQFLAASAGLAGLTMTVGSAGAQTTGGPVELDQLLAETSVDVTTLTASEISGGVVDRSPPIDTIDTSISVGSALTDDEYLIVNDPDGSSNPNLTALQVGSAGNWDEASNLRLIEADSLAYEFDDEDIYVGSGGEWVPILDVSAIPDSVVLQYYATTWSQVDGTWVDDAGTADMSITGDPQATTLSDGSESVTADGVDDYGTITLPAALSGSSLQDFSVEFAVEYSTSNEAELCGSLNANGNQWLRIRLNTDESASTDAGNFHVILADDDGDRLRFSPASNPGLNDGSRHDLSIVINDASANDASVIIDGSSVSVTYNEQQAPNNFVSWDQSMAIWAENNNGSIRDYVEAAVGAIRWHDEAITSQTISDYP